MKLPKKVLVVVDMQNDFITGALRNENAIKIVDNVVNRVQEAVDNDEYIFFTRDTHLGDYLETLEGKNLPVPHCIEGTNGWKIIDELKPFLVYAEQVVDKYTFGSELLGQYIQYLDFSEIELVGVCTDICVISNAMLLKAHFPNKPITVNAKCCAGITDDSHYTALCAMETCQINIMWNKKEK